MLSRSCANKLCISITYRVFLTDLKLGTLEFFMLLMGEQAKGLLFYAGVPGYPTKRYYQLYHFSSA